MTDLVLRSDTGGCATLTINRPEKLNALTVGLFRELRAHVEAIAVDESVGIVVLRGAGRCFSAGHDLADISAGEALPIPNLQSTTIEMLANLPLAVITAVHGHCYTGALELALAGDIILASDNARFADTHAKWALTPIWGMTQRLPRRVGLYRAKEMMLTCRSYSGREAAEMGLANECVADEDFDARLAEIVAEIAGQSWFTHRAVKALLLETDAMPIAQAIAHESFRTRGVGPDAAERLERFANRRG